MLSWPDRKFYYVDKRLKRPTQIVVIGKKYCLLLFCGFKNFSTKDYPQLIRQVEPKGPSMFAQLPSL